MAANPRLADAVQDAVTEVVNDINQEVRKHSPDHARAKSRVKRLQNWHELSEGNVHAAARGDNFEQAAVALSVLACCPIEMAERAILNENPGVVQVIAKAAGCSWATVKALLLMTAADRRMSEGTSTGRATITSGSRRKRQNGCSSSTRPGATRTPPQARPSSRKIPQASQAAMSWMRRRSRSGRPLKGFAHKSGQQNRAILQFTPSCPALRRAFAFMIDAVGGGATCTRIRYWSDGAMRS